MSRYVSVSLRLRSLDEVQTALTALGLPLQRAAGRIMLEGSLECAGEPVDVRLPAGTLDAVEDFGFVADDGAIRLVCGEVDAALLQERLLPPLRAAVVQRRLEANGLQVGDVEAGADGVRRILVTQE